ncbi:SGNH/GDSL hydrolase family protein [Mannheimia haemolytica]|uniref:SGNH/GDSL hydrolase family protein n=1 Tax=Mannheimia haemolytica TaxID=75985 RepID=UPI001ADA3A65|nr:SGNH/GDSL hydrolase family protein [Mannheimia haemolytica]
MSDKRSIRLKEFAANITKTHTPSEDYIRKSPRLERGKSYFQRTNKDGFIETHLNYSAKNNVILIGDSFIENIFVDESKRISSLVEELSLLSNHKIKVHNAGVSGSTSLGLLNLVINKIIPLNPDLIIYTQPSCDFASLIYERGYYNDSKFFSNMTPQKDTEKPYYDTIENNIKQLENNINILSYVCKLYRIPLCIATCCSNSSKRQLKMMNDIIRNGVGYDIIDLDNLVPRIDEYFYDKQHLTEKGSKFISKIFHNYISSKLLMEETAILETRNIVFNNSNNWTSEPIDVKNINSSLVIRISNLSNQENNIKANILDNDDNILRSVSIDIKEISDLEFTLFLNALGSIKINISSIYNNTKDINILSATLYSVL